MLPYIYPETSVDALWWHDSTCSYLRYMPCWSGEAVMGLSFFTDGTAHRDPARAAAGVVLLVHTDHGLRWGGFATALCLGEPTAPRAEATALVLAAL